MQRSIPFLWVLVIILLALNLLLLDILNMARLAAIDSLSKIEATLDSLATEVIVYNFEIDQAVPMKADIPFNRTVEVPLNTSVPINQVLTLPLQTPAGEIVLDVPVQTEVPINMVVPVDFDQTISVDTVVQLETTLPVEIEIAKTPLAAYLKQARSELAQIKRRLSLKRGAPVEETVEEAVPETVSVTIALTPSSTLVEAVEAEAATPVPTAELEGASQPGATSEGLTHALEGASLGLCAHRYWPLWPGTIWTYNSRDTSFSQSTVDVSNNQALLSTRYEGQDIQAGLACSQEGLGGVYLGDMRRITGLGDLNFGNPRGVFLPRPEVMESLGASWRQEMDVTGTVQASHPLADTLVEGQISQGRAVALYTPVRFEAVETPFGPRQALRIEQKLDLELEIVFDLEGQVIPATELVNLSNVYWFAEDIGLVKMQWGGGRVRYEVEVDQTTVTQEFPVPSLAEDQLVFLCISLTAGSAECTRKDGVSESDLTTPPRPELAVERLVLPTGASSEAGPVEEEPGAGEGPDQPSEGGGSAGGDDDTHADLLAYVAAVDSLGQQISGAAERFWEAALKFQNGQLSFDAFRAEFQDFASRLRAVIQGLRQLSPPPVAGAIHERLINGAAMCDQALDVMGEWFDSPSDEKEQAATLLVTGCVEQVTAAVDELRALAGED
ncbi:MAG: hypothetical protein Kow0063_09690 [Anaerolineae bacterium]